VVPDQMTRTGRRAQKANVPSAVADMDFEEVAQIYPSSRRRRSDARAHAALDYLMGEGFDGVMEFITGVAATFSA
jgi:hypothetical protein